MARRQNDDVITDFVHSLIRLQKCLLSNRDCLAPQPTISRFFNIPTVYVLYALRLTKFSLLLLSVPILDNAHFYRLQTKYFYRQYR